MVDFASQKLFHNRPVLLSQCPFHSQTFLKVLLFLFCHLYFAFILGQAIGWRHIVGRQLPDIFIFVLQVCQELMVLGQFYFQFFNIK